MNPYIDRLNRTFGDNVGYVPPQYTRGAREPQYKWVWSPDLLYGGTARNGKFEQFRQHDTDCWVVAKWTAPASRERWAQMFGEELTYPEGGQWVLTDFRLPLGAEPTEALTNWAIGSILEKRSMSFAECASASRERFDKSERDNRRQIDDMIDDACLSYDAVPGKRGGLRSFGGFEQTPTTTERTI